MRAISASRPVHEPARHGPAKPDPADGRTGFPAALDAAAEGIGRSRGAVADDPPQPQSGPLASRSLPSGRSAAADAFAFLTAAAGSLDLSAAEGAGRTAIGAAGSAASLGANGEAAGAPHGDPQPGASATPLAASAPAVPSAAADGTDWNSARLALPLHLRPITELPLPDPDKTGTGKTASVPVERPSHPPEREPGASSHPLAPRVGAAVPAAAGILVASPAGTPGMMIAASPPLARPAAPAAAADPAAGNPEDRFSPAPRLPVDGSLPQRPIATAPPPDRGPAPRGAANSVDAALPGGRGSGPDPDHVSGIAGIAPPRAAPPDTPPASAPDAGRGAPSGPASPADGTGPAAGSPVAASSAPQPQSAAAGSGERSPTRSLPPATARAGAMPALLPGGRVLAPDRPPAHSQEPAALPSGPVAFGTNAPPAADATAAAQPETPAPAPDLSPPNLTGQLSGPIAGAIANGRRDLSLRLHPPELGEVSVRLVVTGRAVSAWFDSPQPQVQQAIGQGMGELRADLAAAGYDLSGAWVGGQAWTPRERTASPLAPRPARPAAGAPAQEVGRTASTAAGAGVSVYV